MRLFVFIFILFTSVHAFSQEKDVEIAVNVKDDDTGKKLGGATVEVYANGQLITSKTSAGNGKLPIMYVETGKYYKIFIKKSGYVTKMAELDARIDILEDAPDPLLLQFETSLFQRVEGVDFNFLETKPMTKFDFDSEYYFRYDKAYTAEMLKKIAALKKEMAEKKKEESEKDKEAAKTEADFRAYVDAGDDAMKNELYGKAVGQYELALALKKGDAEVQVILTEA